MRRSPEDEILERYYAIDPKDYNAYGRDSHVYRVDFAGKSYAVKAYGGVMNRGEPTIEQLKENQLLMNRAHHLIQHNPQHVTIRGKSLPVEVVEYPYLTIKEDRGIGIVPFIEGDLLHYFTENVCALEGLNKFLRSSLNRGDEVHVIPSNVILSRGVLFVVDIVPAIESL